MSDGVSDSNNAFFKSRFQTDLNTKGFSLVYVFSEKNQNTRVYFFRFWNGKSKKEEWTSSGFVYKDPKESSSQAAVISKLYTILQILDPKEYEYKSVYIKSDHKPVYKTLRYVFFISKKDSCVFIKVKSVSSFLTRIINRNIDLRKKEKINSFYRGQLGHWDFKPSLFREENWVKKETELNAQILCDRPNDFQNCKSSFDKLVKLKHYNQPSRLMDLTTNPLVALFFACDSMISNPSFGIGLVISAYAAEGTEKISVVSDTVVMLTALTNARRSSEIKSIKCVCSKDKVIPTRLFDNSSCNECLKEFETSKNEKVPDCMAGKDGDKKKVSNYLGEIKHQAKKESGSELYWDDLVFGELNQCVLVKPPLNTNRIIQQQGCFIMCGLNPNSFDDVPQSYYKFFKPEKNARVFYYIVPDKLDDILKELKVLGIDKYYIYPDLDKDIEVRSDLIKQNKEV